MTYKIVESLRMVDVFQVPQDNFSSEKWVAGFRNRRSAEEFIARRTNEHKDKSLGEMTWR